MPPEKQRKNSPVKSGTAPFRSFQKFAPWLLTALAFLLYANTINHNYNLDDELVTRKHPLTSKGFKGIPEILSSPYYSDNSGNAYEYRPVVLITFAVEHAIFGESPHVSHLINVLLYALLIFVLFKTLRLLFNTYNFWLVFTSVLLFTAHTLHTEVVAGIKNRDEILALLFGITALFAALHFIEKKSYKWLLLTVLCFALGVLSKKSIMPFAVIVPLAIVMFRHPTFKQILLLTLPLAFLAAITSHFFDINLRFLLFSLVLFAVLAAFTARQFTSFKDFQEKTRLMWQRFFIGQKNDPDTASSGTSPNKAMVFAVAALTGLFTVWAVANNSALLLLIVVIINVLPLVFFRSGRSDIFVLNLGISALALLLQNGMVSAVLLYAAYLIMRFNVRNKLHYACAALLLLPLVFNFSSHFVLVFYFFLMAVLVHAQAIFHRKWLRPALALILLLFFTIVNVLSGSFENETIFMIFTMFLFALTFWPTLKESTFKRNIILLFLPLALCSEILFLTSYNIPVARVHTAALSEATDILPASGRTLDFAEMPVNSSTPLHIRTGTAAVALAFYLRLLFVPYPLAFYYGYDTIPIVSITNHWALIAVILHLALLCWALFVFRRKPFISFAVLFYLISISIFSNVFAPVAGVLAERLTFTASLGFCLAITWILAVATSPTLLKNTNIPAQRLFFISMLICASLLAFATVSRNAEWKNHLTLFSNDIVHISRSAQAHNLYASTLLGFMETEKDPAKRQEMLNDAIKHYREAINIYPGFFNASYNLGKALYFAKNLNEAADAFSYTLTIDSADYMTHMYLGIVSDKNKNYPQAEASYLNAIRFKPDFTDAYTNLTALYISTGRPLDAVNLNLKLLEKDTLAYEPNVTIGKIYFGTGRLTEAAFYFERAFSVNSSDKNLINALYEIYNALGMTEKAAYYKEML